MHLSLRNPLLILFVLLCVGCGDTPVKITGTGLNNDPEVSIGAEPGDQDAAAKSPDHPVIEGIAPANGALIEYFDQGQGDAFVLLSGRGLDVGYLAPLAKSLSEAGFRAIRINRRGAGNSKGDLSDITYHTHAADIKGVLDHLGISRAHILGHAVGNRIARIFDADFPQATQSVVLMPASGKVGSSEEEKEATSKMFKPGATEDEIMNGMRYMVGDPANSQRVWEILKYSSLTDPATMKSEVSTTAPVEEWWAPGGHTPYLVLHGTEDKSAPIENAHLLQKDLGERMTLVALDGLGHLAPVEDPDRVTKAILEYFKK